MRVSKTFNYREKNRRRRINHKFNKISLIIFNLKIIIISRLKLSQRLMMILFSLIINHGILRKY